MKNINFHKTTINETELINSAYGDANVFTRIKIFYLRKKHAELNSLFCEHKNTSKSLKKINLEECPEAILPKSVGQAKQQNQITVFSLLTPIIHKPALSAVALIIIIFATLFSVLDNSQEQTFSQLEIELANKQLKQTLLLVSNVFNTSTKQLTKEILSERVANPVNEGMNIIEDYIKEKKNEPLN